MTKYREADAYIFWNWIFQCSQVQMVSRRLHCLSLIVGVYWKLSYTLIGLIVFLCHVHFNDECLQHNGDRCMFAWELNAVSFSRSSPSRLRAALAPLQLPSTSLVPSGLSNMTVIWFNQFKGVLLGKQSRPADSRHTVRVTLSNCMISQNIIKNTCILKLDKTWQVFNKSIQWGRALPTYEENMKPWPFPLEGDCSLQATKWLRLMQRRYFQRKTSLTIWI